MPQKTLPQTPAELYAEFAPLIRNIVWKTVHYGVTREDALAEVWVQLLRARACSNGSKPRAPTSPPPAHGS